MYIHSLIQLAVQYFATFLNMVLKSCLEPRVIRQDLTIHPVIRMVYNLNVQCIGPDTKKLKKVGDEEVSLHKTRVSSEKCGAKKRQMRKSKDFSFRFSLFPNFFRNS